MTTRKVQVSLPESWLKEIDELARKHNIKRSSLIREATRQYLTKKKSKDLRDKLIEGYRAMGEINLELASDMHHDPGESEGDR